MTLEEAEKRIEALEKRVDKVTLVLGELLILLENIPNKLHEVMHMEIEREVKHGKKS